MRMGARYHRGPACRAHRRCDFIKCRAAVTVQEGHVNPLCVGLGPPVATKHGRHNAGPLFWADGMTRQEFGQLRPGQVASVGPDRLRVNAECDVERAHGFINRAWWMRVHCAIPSRQWNRALRAIGGQQDERARTLVADRWSLQPSSRNTVAPVAVVSATLVTQMQARRIASTRLDLRFFAASARRF